MLPGLTVRSLHVYMYMLSRTFMNRRLFSIYMSISISKVNGLVCFSESSKADSHAKYQTMSSSFHIIGCTTIVSEVWSITYLAMVTGRLFLSPMELI